MKHSVYLGIFFISFFSYSGESAPTGGTTNPQIKVVETTKNPIHGTIPIKKKQLGDTGGDRIINSETRRKIITQVEQNDRK